MFGLHDDGEEMTPEKQKMLDAKVYKAAKMANAL